MRIDRDDALFRIRFANGSVGISRIWKHGATETTPALLIPPNYIFWLHLLHGFQQSRQTGYQYAAGCIVGAAQPFFARACSLPSHFANFVMRV